MGNLLQELKRRNVFRVGVAYLVLGWLIIEVADTVFPQFEFPLWTNQFVTLLVILGFPIAVFFAWAFEITPDGIKRESDVNREDSITTHTGRNLNFLIIGILVVSLGYFVYESRFAEDITITDKSVAVLPFIDLSRDRSEAWFSDGLTEEILNSLAQLPELMVSARTSSFKFRGEDRVIPDIARQLGVSYVVEGSVRRLDDELRITAQLIRAEDGFHLWSQTYNNSTAALFDVQEDVAEKIASALNVFLDDERRELMFQNGTRNVEAFEAFLRGAEIYSRVHGGPANVNLWDANVFFARAMALDPAYAAPALMHSDAFSHVVIGGNDNSLVKGDNSPMHSAEVAMDLLMEDLDRAIANAPNPVLLLVAELNREYFSPTWHRMPGLIARFRGQIDSYQSRAAYDVWLTEILSLNDEQELLRRLAESNMRSDPLAPGSWTNMAAVERMSGNSEAALELLIRGRATTGGGGGIIENMAISIAYNDGNRDEIIAGLEAISDQLPIAVAHLAAVTGDYAEATRLAADLEASQDWPDRNLLLIYHETGDQLRSRALTEKIDALPAGSAILATFYTQFGNALAFDLSAAPNFAAQLQQAGVDLDSFKELPRLSTIN